MHVVLVGEPPLEKESGWIDQTWSWKVFGVLLLAALVGAIGVIPYALALTPAIAPAGGPPLAVLLVASVAQSLILAGLAITAGLWLGPRVGLGAPLLARWLEGDQEAAAQIQATALPSVVAGILVAIAIAALDILVFAPRLGSSLALAGANRPSPGLGLLAALYGGINEELLLRFGLMTLLVWLGMVALRRSRSNAGLVWTANLAVAVLFGLGHLPATAAILPLTPLVVTRAVVLNGLAGVVFGWLYWRRGIVSAMLAHLASDVVLQVLVPLLLA